MTQTKLPHMTDYEAERRNFHLDVPAQFNFAIDIIGKWAADPSKLAMLWVGQNGEEKHLTFAYFAERSSRAANAFAKLGITKGDRIMVTVADDRLDVRTGCGHRHDRLANAWDYTVPRFSHHL